MRALVTGACGQDGRLLRASLLRNGFDVLGIDRVSATASDAGVVHNISLTDEAALTGLFDRFAPDHVYHLAACHHSSEHEGDAKLDREMVETNFWAASVLIDIIARRRPSCRILLAGTSQMYQPFGGQRTLIDEATPTHPGSFYGQTKAWSRDLLTHYRRHRGIFGSMAIMFNHESPLRPPNFVTRKISIAAARAATGHETNLHLRDISSETDWSSASDVVEGLRLALMASEPADFVLASGVVHRVEDVLEAAFNSVHLNWKDFTTFSPLGSRQRGSLVGNAARAKSVLGWCPTTGFERMISDMVAHDVSVLRATEA